MEQVVLLIWTVAVVNSSLKGNAWSETPVPRENGAVALGTPVQLIVKVRPVLTRTSLPITTFSEGTCTLKIRAELEDEVEGKRW
jgi:hypothetical protein